MAALLGGACVAAGRVRYPPSPQHLSWASEGVVLLPCWGLKDAQNEKRSKEVKFNERITARSGFRCRWIITRGRVGLLIDSFWWVKHFFSFLFLEMSWFISFSLADLFVLLMAACRHQMRRFVRQLFFLKKPKDAASKKCASFYLRRQNVLIDQR